MTRWLENVIKVKALGKRTFPIIQTTNKFNTKYRLILVSQKLEYPKQMLKAWILVTVDDEILHRESK